MGTPVWLHVSLQKWQMCITFGRKSSGREAWVPIPENRKPYVDGTAVMIVNEIELPCELFIALEQEIRVNSTDQLVG